MPAAPVCKIGHPVLRQKCASVPTKAFKEEALRQFLDVMVDTMRKQNGVGLAANQIGLPIRAAVLENRTGARYPSSDSFKLERLLNLRIVEYSKKTEEDWEGCLSIPGYRGLVARAKWVIYEAMDETGRKFRRKVSGFHARVIQHETDHLNGYFYMDRMKDLNNWMHLNEFNRLLGLTVKEHD